MYTEIKILPLSSCLFHRTLFLPHIKPNHKPFKEKSHSRICCHKKYIFFLKCKILVTCTTKQNLISLNILPNFLRTFYIVHFFLRPHVTSEKAVKSSNSFQSLFFLFAICGKFQQSVAFLLYLLRFKAIDGHFANSLRYLLRFCNSL